MGDKGDVVAGLQNQLQCAGFYRGALNGTYGAPLVDAVKYFQQHMGLTANGVMNPPTWLALHSLPPNSSPIGLIPLKNTRTSSIQPGASLSSAPTPIATAARKARSLTPGEIALSQTIFKGAINYSKVKVHKKEFLPFGVQPDDTAMTPNGEMYFNKKHFKEDFSIGWESDKHWFIHEMVHVWQYQLGYNVQSHGVKLHLRGGDPYAYTLSSSSRIQDYNMEQQGDVIADYFSVLNGFSVMSSSGYSVQDTSLFGIVLADFIKDPSNKKLLPKRQTRGAQDYPEWP
ncbi:MAG TPA: peptidoglycan-binding domain-containing protein [Myxococcaceae bacterium]|nr:peptidoglycan-binding domain-containing protein [Myxococcaceae bacterium]